MEDNKKEIVEAVKNTLEHVENLAKLLDKIEAEIEEEGVWFRFHICRNQYWTVAEWLEFISRISGADVRWNRKADGSITMVKTTGTRGGFSAQIKKTYSVWETFRDSLEDFRTQVLSGTARRTASQLKSLRGKLTDLRESVESLSK